jgi:signal transduction histidine kinase
VWIHFAPQQARVVDCSGAVDAQLQYSSAELRSQPLRVLADPSDWHDPRGVWRALCEGREVSEQPLRVLTRRGHPRLMQAQAVVLGGREASEPVGLLQLHDIGERWPQEASEARDRERLQTLAYEITLAESRERERLAQQLHDDLGQLLAVAQLRVSELSSRSEAAREDLLSLRELLSQAAKATRATSLELHSPLLQQLGFQAALEALAERLAQQTGIELRVLGELPQLPLADAVLAVLLRVVRELLSNVRKHAQARRVDLVLQASPDDVLISVHDDGNGLLGGRAAGFGLRSAEAQLQALGGRLHLEGRPGQGSCALLVMPFKPEFKEDRPA